jgi:hypothetical protein
MVKIKHNKLNQANNRKQKHNDKNPKWEKKNDDRNWRIKEQK